MIQFNSPLKKKIYTQTGNFSFQFDILFDNHSGVCDIGFYSYDRDIPFRFASGRIFDANDNYISSYTRNRIYSMSGNVSENSIDYYLNGEALGFGVPAGSGDIDYFFVNPSGCNVNLNLIVNGDRPLYDYSDYLYYHTGDSILPISINNHSALPFTIFSGRYNGDSSKFSIDGLDWQLVTNGTQFFVYPSGEKTAGFNDINIDLFTDFGIENISIRTSGIQDLLPFYNIQLYGPHTVDNNEYSIFYCYFSNPSGEIEILPSLNYLSGSGIVNINVPITGAYSTTVTGEIIGEGYLYSNVSVQGTGMSPSGNQVVDTISGLVSGFQYATGNHILPYSIPATGRGIINGLEMLGSGILTGNKSGIIYDGSGSLLFNETVLGSVTELYSINPTGYIDATGVINYDNLQNGDIIFIGGGNAIIKGITYSSITELNTYLNNNIPNHLVTSQISGGNKIVLTAFNRGTVGNNTIFENGIGNQGTNTIEPIGFLQGGQDLGKGTLLAPIGLASGLLNKPLYGSGIYSKTQEGQMVGSSLYPDYSKTFIDVWDLKTGNSLSSLISFKDNGYFTPESLVNASIKGDNTSFYIRVDYNNSYGTADLSELIISGVNFPSGIKLTLTGII